MLDFGFDTGIAICCAYLLGSISCAIITCKLMGLPDPRSQGSGNPGATNVLRFGNKKAAIITLIGDIVKGVIPVFLAKEFALTLPSLSCVMLAAFLGHLYPVFFHFKGGKGVATAFGCLLALAWPVGLMLACTWLIVAWVFRYSSLAAIIAALTAPFYVGYFAGIATVPATSVLSALLIYRHRENIHKLFLGTENKIRLHSGR